MRRRGGAYAMVPSARGECGGRHTTEGAGRHDSVGKRQRFWVVAVSAWMYGEALVRTVRRGCASWRLAAHACVGPRGRC
jgi:hypothetical protein